MIVYRVFDWDGKTQGNKTGGPLFVPRQMQGPGRFDLPHLDGVLYTSQSPLGAVAEALQGFRSRFISNRHFQRSDGRQKAVATLEVDANCIDLDDPKTLAKLTIQPSQVITHHREVTHTLAERLYKGGADGLLWPSSIEGSWKNVSLFESRVQSKIKMMSEIQLLTIKLPMVKEAAQWLNISLAANAKPRRK